MPGRMLPATLLFLLLSGGCSGLQKPEATSDGWLTRARRQMAQVARDIEADLDFHENEGLEAFDPNAVRQVNAMRSDMNGAGVSR